jgi:hypothetical protein
VFAAPELDLGFSFSSVPWPSLFFHFCSTFCFSVWSVERPLQGAVHAIDADYHKGGGRKERKDRVSRVRIGATLHGERERRKDEKGVDLEPET